MASGASFTVRTMYRSFCSKPIFNRRVMLASSSTTRMRFLLFFIVPGTLATFFRRRKPFLALRSQHQLRHDPALASVPDVYGPAMHIHDLFDHREAQAAAAGGRFGSEKDRGYAWRGHTH